MAKLITADDIANRCRVKKPTVLRWHRDGRMPPAVRLNDRVVRWPAAAIDQWLDQQAGKPDAECSSQSR